MSDDPNQVPSQPAPAEPPVEPPAYTPPPAAPSVEPPAYTPPPAAPSVEQPAPYAPPPPTAPGYAPAAAPPQPPAKKSRKGLWIAVAIIAFLVLCCGGSCVGYVVYNAAQEQAAFGRAFDKIDAANKVFADATSDPSSEDPQALAAEIKPQIAAMRTAIGEAKAEIEPLSDSENRTAALQALASLDKAFQKLDTLMNGLADLATFSRDIQAVGTLVKDADNATSDGIDAANGKRWDEASNFAATAIAKYTEAEAKSAELEKKRPGIGMADMQRIIALKRAAAEKLSVMARYGRSGSTSSYNKAIDDYNALQKQVRTSTQPAIINNPDLLLGDLEKTMNDIETESQAALDALEKLK